MYSHAMLLYFLTETPLHAGSGRGLGGVDLPIQRERITGYPMIQASGIKGKLRAEAVSSLGNSTIANEKINLVFGPEAKPGQAPDHAGAISPGDARLLLLPVRSLAGVFAWTTSLNVLARFARDAAAAGVSLESWKLDTLTGEKALVAAKNEIVGGGKIVLEEYSFTPTEDAQVQVIGEWLAKHALPTTDEYEYWRKKLPRSLVILPEDDFRDFSLYATEVATRVQLDDQTKTVKSGALWTEEALPSETLLYVPVFASAPRGKSQNGLESGEDVLNFIKKLSDKHLKHVQLGGDETVGRGLTALRAGEVHHV